MSYSTQKRPLYSVNQESSFKDAFLILERPHRGPSRLWHAWSENDFIEKVTSAADQARIYADFDDFGSALDFLSHDLREVKLIRFNDILDSDMRAEYIESEGPILKAILFLEWLTKIEN